jgi:hypothetical protein
MARTRHLQNDRQQRGGLLRSWLRNALLFGIGASEVIGAADVEQSVLRSDDVAGLQPNVAENKSTASGHSSVVLPFPIHGEALLVRLAELLRRRVGNFDPMHDPFLFAISRRPGSWLAIDSNASVEFVTSRCEFRFKVDVAPNTSIVITTANFDSLVEFVMQYVSARLAEPPSLETVS